MGSTCCGPAGRDAELVAVIRESALHEESVCADKALDAGDLGGSSSSASAEDSGGREGAAVAALEDAETDVEDSDVPGSAHGGLAGDYKRLHKSRPRLLRQDTLRSNSGLSTVSGLSGDGGEARREVDEEAGMQACVSTTSSCRIRGSEHLRCGDGFCKHDLRHHSREEILNDMRTHLDTTHDILAAEELVGELKHRMTREEWAEFQDDEIMQRFRERLEQFYDIGTSCCLETDEWFVAYEDRRCGTKLECMQDHGAAKKLSYRLSVVLPAAITRAVALTLEHDLVPTWNPHLSKPPAIVGEFSAFDAVVKYSGSLYGGLYKVDLLSEVQRFVDSEAGFMAEAVAPVSEWSEQYAPPAKGHTRLESEFKRLWVAVGSNETVVIQAGSCELPFAANRAFISLMAQTTGRRMIKRMRQAALRAMQPGSPWDPALEEDKQGLYGLLDRCASSAGSLQRAAAGAAAADETGAGSPAVAASLRPDDIQELFCQRPGNLRKRTAGAVSAASAEDPGGAAMQRKPSLKKQVSFGPSAEVRTIPDRAGHTKEYRFLAEQHNRLNDAVRLAERYN